MSVVALGSLKSAPGVTTATLCLGLAWPTAADVLIAELDADGADLASWLNFGQQPGLLSLAAAARHEQSAALVPEHAQKINDRLSVLVGPLAANHARAALDRSVPVVEMFGRGDAVAIADLGRLTERDARSQLWEAADVSVIVLRPTAGALQHFAAVQERLNSAPNLKILLVGAGHYGADEIASTLGVEVLGTIAQDDRAAAAIAGGRADVKQLRRSKLLRSSASVAQLLTECLANNAGSDRVQPVSG